MKKMNRTKTGGSTARVSPARWTAFQVLQQAAQGNSFLDDLLRTSWKKSPLSSEDRRLSHIIVHGIRRNRARLDFWIDRMSTKGIESLPPAIVDILRMALFQIAFLERIPPHAAVNEAVALCDTLSMGSIKGLVNAILRRFPDRRAELDREIEADPRRIEIETSHPDWMVAWAKEAFGSEKAEQWLHSNNRAPLTHLVPLVGRFAVGESPLRRLVEEIEGARISEEGRSVILPTGLILSELPALCEGRAFVQDIGAGLAVTLLDPRPGETVFDLCSAPGGKTLQIADLLAGQGRLVSVDSSARRLEILKENLSRCGFDSVEVVERDLTQPWPEALGAADAVLVDVPCSGLGTLRRKVDLRDRIRPKDIRELAEKGRKILETAASLVKPGGRLAFSTCTLTREENEEVVRDFLSSHSDQWTLEAEEKSPDWLFGGESNDAADDSDGSYRALLRRNASPTEE